ncbi:hypothetical protein ACJIZ3_017376 [Penstemon smallii]|uniref:Rho-GAP domain-containing protein n=1 Tax=Penstemon smallii TaxID=265156 RepID=A0ABD3SVD4_9LAMI
MTEVLHSPTSSSSPSISTPTQNPTLFHLEEEVRENDRRGQLSLFALLVTLFRKRFWLACKTDSDNFSSSTTAVGGGGGGGVMEIGWPTDVQHVNHVTFDSFDGFLGLPVEFEPEVSSRAPSASATVFGVSTESMQLSYDSRGNIIPTILLLMQRHLYSQGGLQSEGIFRITGGNSQEVYVRDQLNRGVVPESIDIHCMAGLIKAWFRELPRGVLDSLAPEQVIQCQSEEDCSALVRLLPPTEASLLDWAINLMADVVQEEHRNKMNTRNIAMVFAPNMTQLADPLTALVYAVQVMNFLKILIEKTLREREESFTEPPPIPHIEPSGENDHQSSSRLDKENHDELNVQTIQTFGMEDPGSDSGSDTNQVDNITEEEDPARFYRVSVPREDNVVKGFHDQCEEYKITNKTGQTSYSNQSKFESGTNGQEAVDNKSKGISNLSRLNSMTERFEAWR